MKKVSLFVTCVLVLLVGPYKVAASEKLVSETEFNFRNSFLWPGVDGTWSEDNNKWMLPGFPDVISSEQVGIGNEGYYGEVNKNLYNIDHMQEIVYNGTTNVVTSMNGVKYEFGGNTIVSVNNTNRESYLVFKNELVESNIGKKEKYKIKINTSSSDSISYRVGLSNHYKYLNNGPFFETFIESDQIITSKNNQENEFVFETDKLRDFGYTVIAIKNSGYGTISFNNLKILRIKDETKVSGISMTPETFTIKTGKSKLLYPKVSPETAINKKVTYKSSDASIAKVLSNGKVQGLKKGVATITVTTEDGGYTAQSIITVD